MVFCYGLELAPNSRKPASTEVEAGLANRCLSYIERVRLEAVTQTDDNGVRRGICITSGGTLSGRGFPLILHIGSDSVDVRALAERVVVANAYNIALEVKGSAVVGIFEAVGGFSPKRALPPQRGASPEKVMP